MVQRRAACPLSTQYLWNICGMRILAKKSPLNKVYFAYFWFMLKYSANKTEAVSCFVLYFLAENFSLTCLQDFYYHLPYPEMTSKHLPPCMSCCWWFGEDWISDSLMTSFTLNWTFSVYFFPLPQKMSPCHVVLIKPFSFLYSTTDTHSDYLRSARRRKNRQPGFAWSTW